MRAVEPVIEVSGLRVERDTVVLERIDWRVERGENWVILGPNGSGKTSLLSALTGYLPPSAGSISVLGQTYGRTDWRDLRTRIGLVSSAINQMMPAHEAALNTVMSGKRAMIGLWGDTEAKDRARAIDILRQVEAQPLADRPWRVLSQGERQRVLIGRALMSAPELLILDEPCAGLDPVAREIFLNFLQRMCETPDAPALVLITHHVEEITPGFSHVLILRAGHVAASGRKSEVMTSRILSEAFGVRVDLSLTKERYFISVAAEAWKIV